MERFCDMGRDGEGMWKDFVTRDKTDGVAYTCENVTFCA